MGKFSENIKRAGRNKRVGGKCSGKSINLQGGNFLANQWLCWLFWFLKFQWHSWCGKISTILHIYWPLKRKFSPADLIPPCTFIDFAENFPPARLFRPARLMFSKNFPTCTFILPYTSIRHTRVNKVWISDVLGVEPHLFTHQNPTNVTISWLTITIFLSCMVWFAN